MQYRPTGPLGRIEHATSGTKLTENLVKLIELSAMHKFGMGQEKKTPSILSLNLTPLVELSDPSHGAFSQEGMTK